MKVHLIGMGGIGMSGLAQLLLGRGAEVTGSDLSDGPLLRKIRRLGGQVFIGHRAANLDHPDVVVYSSSISPRNPELRDARNRGLTVLHRGQMVAELVSGCRTVAVTGAHGKSTTTGLAAQLLIEAGWDPSVVMGAESLAFGSNARVGAGPYAVVEADESDGSLLWLSPWAALITNMDEEHLDYFRNRWELEETYAAFAERVHPDGTLIGCADDPAVLRLLSGAGRRKITYGLSPRADVRAEAVECLPGRSRYRCLYAGRVLGAVELTLPGLHNVVNSLGVAALALALGIDFPAAQRAFARYPGAKRRFEVLGKAGGVTVVEDYAHHPVEIRATLESARVRRPKRIRCVFQPHRYSRIKYLLEQFRGCFEGADEVILLPIYAASEDPLAGITDTTLLEAVGAVSRRGPSRRLSEPRYDVPDADTVRRTGFGSSVGRVSLLEPDAALAHLARTARSGDLVLFMGAGSIGKLPPRLLASLRTSKKGQALFGRSSVAPASKKSQTLRRPRP